MNPILEISRKIKEFEMTTGLSPNLIIVNERIELLIKRMLKNRIALIEFYPDVFQLPFRVNYRIEGFEVQLSLGGK